MQSNFTKLSLDKGKALLQSKTQNVDELLAIEVLQNRAAASNQLSVHGVNEEVDATKKEAINLGVV